MPQVKVIITLKASLLDAQGRVVQDALHNMGYANVSGVRIGKYVELDVESADRDSEQIAREVGEMCDRFLANPVIENYRFELTP